MPLLSIAYTKDPPSLSIIDQLQLPHETEHIRITDSVTAFNAIRSMQVRGAPAIAIVAVLAVAVELQQLNFPITPSRAAISPADTSTNLDEKREREELEGLGTQAAAQAVQTWIQNRLLYLIGSRPTAVNLQDAATKLTTLVGAAAEIEGRAKQPRAAAEGVRRKYVQAAEQMLHDDVKDNENIGREGAQWIKALAPSGTKVSVLTHCNTGSLATAGCGTALGVIHALHDDGALRRAIYTETRPYNQGSRLTGYELLHAGIPATLITDSMAGALFRLKARTESLVAVVVGADRVAANGDTANKIGTYGLAVLARQHGVKFVVAAPRTTVDLKTASGADIVIEERDAKEMLAMRGPKVVGWEKGVQVVDARVVETVSTAALGTEVWNPAFDVTPAELIDAIVTEVGVVEKVDGSFDMRSISNLKVRSVKIDGEGIADGT